MSRFQPTCGLGAFVNSTLAVGSMVGAELWTLTDNTTASVQAANYALQCFIATGEDIAFHHFISSPLVVPY